MMTFAGASAAISAAMAAGSTPIVALDLEEAAVESELSPGLAKPRDDDAKLIEPVTADE